MSEGWGAPIDKLLDYLFGGWHVALTIFLGSALTMWANEHDLFPVALSPVVATAVIIAGIFSGLRVAVWAGEGIVGATKRSIASRRHIATMESRANAEALANIQTLDRNELGVLLELLKSGNTRFSVHIVSEAYPLLAKGILIEKRRTGSEWICELAPAILSARQL